MKTGTAGYWQRKQMAELLRDDALARYEAARRTKARAALALVALAIVIMVASW